MSITTYAELKSSISSWLNRDDLTAVIPDFISLAEAGINRDLRHYKMVNRVDATLDSRYVQVPADWLETLRFSLTTDGTRPLEMASLDDMIKYRQDNSTALARLNSILTLAKVSRFFRRQMANTECSSCIISQYLTLQTQTHTTG